mgnify:CR=1 FL=1
MWFISSSAIDADPAASAVVVGAHVSGPSLFADAVHAPAGADLRLGSAEGDALVISDREVRVVKPLVLDPDTTLFVGAIRSPHDSVHLLSRDGGVLLDVTEDGLDLAVPLTTPALYADEIGPLLDVGGVKSRCDEGKCGRSEIYPASAAVATISTT